jgi:hypothetical protein
MKLPQGGQLQEKVQIKWSPSFAYAIGLIASDGNLSKDERHITFISKERELANKFKQALALDNKFIMSARGGETKKKYYNVRFGDKVFYQFLNSIGLTAAKSKTIQSVDIPDNFFRDFLRGLFDGDGTFYTFWDTRWTQSFCFKMAFASASPVFIRWLKERLTKLYNTKGYIHKGQGVENLEYSKGDTKKLSSVMYHPGNLLYLTRKYRKVGNAVKRDEILGLPFLQKQRRAAVAHW